MVQKPNSCLAALVAFVSLLGIAGCGGSGASQFHNPSVFAGTYTGTWVYGPTGANGPANVVVATDQQLTGTLHDDNTSTDNALLATIKNSGDCLGTLTPDGSSPIIVSGTLTVSAQGHLAGTLDEMAGGNLLGQISIDLVKSP